MDGLARFHARWWGCSQKKPLKWAQHPLTSFAGLLRNAVPVLTLQGFKLLPKLMAEMKHPDGSPVATFGTEYTQILGWRKQLRGRLRYVTRQLLRPPLTLCHCDTHLENIFFHERYAGGCAFIDFGNMRFQHALSDVSFFIATCVDTDCRRQHERALIRRYHEQLVAHGVTDYSFDLCWHDYRMQIWLAFVQLIAQAPDFLKQRKARTGMFAQSPTEANATLLAMYKSQNTRCAEALHDHDWIAMVADERKACSDYFCCSCCAT
jgi:hypothetical protein